MNKILVGSATLGAVIMFASTALAAAVPPPPPTVPTEVDQCKKGGWELYNGMFKNQGDCVSFVVTGGKNPPAGPSA